MAEINTRGRMGEEAVGTIREQAKDAMSTAKELAGQAKEKVQDWTSTAKDKAQEVASAAAGKVRGAIGAAGEYFQEHDVQDIGRDALNFARRYPLSTLLVGVGLGFVLAKLTSGRS